MAYGLNCGGGLKILAVIRERPVIERIFVHLGMRSRAVKGTIT